MNVLQYALALVIPILPPILIHLEAKPSHGDDMALLKGKEEGRYSPRSVFINELPMSLFANTIWAITYSIQNLKETDVLTWNVIYFILGSLEIGLMIASRKRISNLSYYIFAILVIISVVLLTIKRIESPAF